MVAYSTDAKSCMLSVSPAFTKFFHCAHLGHFHRDKCNAKGLSDD